MYSLSEVMNPGEVCWDSRGEHQRMVKGVDDLGPAGFRPWMLSCLQNARLHTTTVDERLTQGSDQPLRDTRP